MTDQVMRLFVEKKDGFDVEANAIYVELKEILQISGLTSVRLINRYDVQGMGEYDFLKAASNIFSEPQVDNVYMELFACAKDEIVFAVEFLPGQYDQRADSAAQCVQLLTGGKKPIVNTAKLYVLKGNIAEDALQKIKKYLINPVESRESSLDKPTTLTTSYQSPPDVKIFSGFIQMDDEQLYAFHKEMAYAMSIDDLMFCRTYFTDTEKRDPSVTELKLIDTYWSDHCRHTTFLTELENVEFDSDDQTKMIQDTYHRYMNIRSDVYKEKAFGANQKKICLMDIATLAMKKLKKDGKLSDLDESDEVNACSIVADVDVDGEIQEWLIMFKNETHNHPTEIEPFGGAATCLGGAIRDPLSGRAYVYQAMRVTGSGDPRTPVAETIAGKLPQRKITTSAAAGYSSYGNQIGIPAGHVREIYHEGYIAKRMEIGAVIGAVPKCQVVRDTPKNGDVVILMGGRTGRDGIGGATGSSKEHTEESLATCGSEVQKGNPPEERKILRLFRNPEVTKRIIRCNDFGAGGVSVAIGELADGLTINLDSVPKKYEGLDGTELAVSESQERMAVVVAAEDADKMIALAAAENIEATVVANINDSNRIKMLWRETPIVDIDRDFLNTNGATQKTNILVTAPELDELRKAGLSDKRKVIHTEAVHVEDDVSLEVKWLQNLSDLNVCSQKGLVERFDSTVGGNTVLMPFGGKHQMTPVEGMAAKVPVPGGKTNTVTLMTYGYDPKITSISPFHGAVYAVLESLSKIAAMGGDVDRIRLTFQEYFEKPGTDPKRWGKPLAALLGAFYAQMELSLPAIGGKDSMSGSFMDLDVPPTLVSFAVSIEDARNVISSEFKKAGSRVVLIPTKFSEEDDCLPDLKYMKQTYNSLYIAVKKGLISAAMPIRTGGVAAALSTMGFGNHIGFEMDDTFPAEILFQPLYGSILVETNDIENAANAGNTESANSAESSMHAGAEMSLEALLPDCVFVGKTIAEPVIRVGQSQIPLENAKKTWRATLNDIFPEKRHEIKSTDPASCEAETKVEAFFNRENPQKEKIHILPRGLASPKVLLIAMPGTNCEYESAYAFERAGAQAEILVVKNRSTTDIRDSIQMIAKKMKQSNIIMLPGGFSAGDEPDGSGKFTATFFRNQEIAESVTAFLTQQDGLMLGVCNGFQALVKLGLLPYGKIVEPKEGSPTLTFNQIGRFVSRIAHIAVCDNPSPWLTFAEQGEVFAVPVAHAEGRFYAQQIDIDIMKQNGQIATQYVDESGNPTMAEPYNPNGSTYAIEGITSLDGRIFGKMGHAERTGNMLLKNIDGNVNFKVFESGVKYFRG